MKVRAILNLKNDLVYNARKELGLNQTEFGKLCGVSVGAICAIERFDFNEKKLSSAAVRKIAEFVGCNPEEIAPPELAGVRIASTFSQIKAVDPRVLLASATVHRAMHLPEPDALYLKERNDTLRRGIAALSFRERSVLTYRFGLDGSPERTLEQTAQVLKVTRERVRALEARALTKLRKPALERAIDVDT